MQKYFDRLIEFLISSVPNLLTALAIFLVSLYLARVVSKLLRRVLERREVAPGTAHLLAQITRWAIIVLGVVTALQRFFDVTAFLAGLGILGFTVGFALQNIMQNFVAGVILLFQQPFKIGDVVNVAGFDGTILQIDLRTTEMRTLDGRIVTVPNGDILAGAIVNYTRAKRLRVDLSVGVSYDSDAAQTRKVVLEALCDVPGFVSEPKPMVAFHTFAGSSIDLTAYFWIDTTATNPILARDAALELVKVALERNGIEIPFPITTVHLEK
ncbi:MAG: small-conductance mechanosensitive channel MscS [Anaerolineales bacterium]